MRKTLISSGMLILGIIIALSGCSSTTESTIDSEQLAESLQAQTDMMVYSMSGFMDDGIDYVNYGAGYTKPADTSYFTFDNQTYWWTYTREWTLASESMDWTIDELDSVRFRAGDTYQVSPDETTDGLEVRIIGEDLMSFTIDSTMGAQYDIDFDFDNADSDTVDVDGTFDYILEIVMGDFEFAYDFDCAYDEIRIVNDPTEFSSYPVSGTMTLNVTISSNGDQASGIPEGTWTASVTLTFTDDGYSGTMTIEGDNYTWDSDWSDLSGVLPVSRP